MKQVAIVLGLGGDLENPDVLPALRSLALIGKVGDPSVARVAPGRWEVRDGLGNLVGSACVSEARPGERVSWDWAILDAGIEAEKRAETLLAEVVRLRKAIALYAAASGGLRSIAEERDAIGAPCPRFEIGFEMGCYRHGHEGAVGGRCEDSQGRPV